MNKIELIDTLIKQVKELPLLDELALDALEKRAQMIAAKVFGNSSHYLVYLHDVSFYSDRYGPTQHDKEVAWNRGQVKVFQQLKIMREDIELSMKSGEGVEEEAKSPRLSKSIFIVHGHDGEMKQAVARVLEKLELEPIVLHEKPDKGRTIIEKFTDYSDVGYAIVCLSPDDIGYEKKVTARKESRRARQNVIFELGFFIGKIGRDRVFPLYSEAKNFELPSDYSGVIYTPYDEIGAWKTKLVQELKSVGYEIDANKLVE